MTVAVIPVPGLPLVTPGMDLGQLLGDAIDAARVGVKPRDVVVVCQKVVSKAEGAVVALADVEPSPFARTLAAQGSEPRDPRALEVVLREARRIVRNDRGHLIVETRHGWVCANAGVDQSNGVAAETLTLLPADADASAARLRAALETRFGGPLAVVVTDTFGRPWREGLVEVAIGCAGIDPLLDFRGERDLLGRTLHHTVVAVADEVAAAAGLVMAKGSGVAAAIVRGVVFRPDGCGASALVRRSEFDLFR
ncbi:MAG TPA: coenzyme F420-0:L-glutamate ligase [Candidatus Limnocylindria bacterium]|nr:coenzyme F420-0:L-glutamate ligase [Candidatus Limnocylindria bacterium]